MSKVILTVREWYPVYEASTPEGTHREFEVDEQTLARWRAAVTTFRQVQHEMSLLANPRCPECGHPIIRHQEHSAGWDNWGCLDWVTTSSGERRNRCRCRYGCPPERLAQLEGR